MSHPAADPEYWVKRWEDKVTDLPFHKADVNPWLLSNHDVLTGGHQSIKIFVPLCGKSMDLKWLFHKGHTIVGVEVSPIAIEEFFNGHDINYICENAEKCKGVVYRSEDEKIKLYCCDLFDFNSEIEGQFDAIWDRGSLVAIVPEHREQYYNLMLSLMAPACQYIWERLIYDIPGKTGPPHCVPMESIEKGLGEQCEIKSLERTPSPEDVLKFKAVFFDIETLQITLK